MTTPRNVMDVLADVLTPNSSKLAEILSSASRPLFKKLLDYHPEAMSKPKNSPTNNQAPADEHKAGHTHTHTHPITHHMTQKATHVARW